MNCEEIKNKIVKFIHDEVGKTGLDNVIIGLSGGVDSSLVATLAVEAIGKDRVIGVLMPRYSHQTDIVGEGNFKDSYDLAKSLGIRFIVHPLDVVIKEKYLSNKSKERVGNICARTRMAILYDYSAEHNGLVLGTTNKSELLLGYLTKYGDGGVDLEPIADLYKTEVWKLAKYKYIPERIVNKPPSDDLWEGHKDEDDLGDYTDVDQILWWLTEERYTAIELERNLEQLTGITDKGILTNVISLMCKNRHKTHMPNSCKIRDIMSKDIKK
jgi:NAD+ synthase